MTACAPYPFEEPSRSSKDTPPLRSEFDRIFEGLSNRHRRLILLWLNRDMVENRTDLVPPGEFDRTNFEIELSHNHLPKLDNMGYVEWNSDTGDLSKGPRFDEVEPFLELLERLADDSS